MREGWKNRIAAFLTAVTVSGHEGASNSGTGELESGSQTVSVETKANAAKSLLDTYRGHAKGVIDGGRDATHTSTVVEYEQNEDENAKEKFINEMVENVKQVFPGIKPRPENNDWSNFSAGDVFYTISGNLISVGKIKIIPEKDSRFGKVPISDNIFEIDADAREAHSGLSYYKKIGDQTLGGGSGAYSGSTPSEFDKISYVAFSLGDSKEDDRANIAKISDFYERYNQTVDIAPDAYGEDNEAEVYYEIIRRKEELLNDKSFADLLGQQGVAAFKAQIAYDKKIFGF